MNNVFLQIFEKAVRFLCTVEFSRVADGLSTREACGRPCIPASFAALYHGPVLRPGAVKDPIEHRLNPLWERAVLRLELDPRSKEVIDRMADQDHAQLTRQVWQAGLDSVKSDALVEAAVQPQSSALQVAGVSIPYDAFDRILVVGGGKAGTGMVRGLQRSLYRARQTNPERWRDQPVLGWVNVPADCVPVDPAGRAPSLESTLKDSSITKADATLSTEPLSTEPLSTEPLSTEQLSTEQPMAARIHLHPGRPAGVNEPTSAGAEGSLRILKLVQSAGPRDIVICLISGGGSALLPCPVPGVSVEQKAAAVRLLSSRGANINELNLLRRALSGIKGGGLIRDFAGHSFHTLIISDVMGNPLETIASGPTVPARFSKSEVLQLLNQYDPDQSNLPAAIRTAIQNQTDRIAAQLPPNVYNTIVGDIETAVQGAAKQAAEFRFPASTRFATQSEPDVREVSRRIIDWLEKKLEDPDAAMLIDGGEPTVNLELPPGITTGKGGRNQQLSLLILKWLIDAPLSDQQRRRVQFLSGGTDGEDGPTDAAGALANLAILKRAEQAGLDPAKYLERFDAYSFFDRLGGLVKSGPTHTNVGDLRIASVSSAASSFQPTG